MKRLSKTLFLMGCSICFAQISAAQQHKEHIEKQFSHVATGTVVAVYNIFGNIKVEGYAGDQVTISVDETIKADNESELEQARKEFKLGFEQKADSVIAYTAEPYDTRPHDHYHNHDDDRHYIVMLDYVLKVPYNVSLRLSTINDGKIEIRDVHGALKANNINGPILIANAKGTTEAHTINGDLTVNYLTPPPEASSYYTLNGKLEVSYPSSFNGDVQLKSMNGQFYTDFPNTEALPTQVTKSTDNRHGGITYKLEKTTRVRFGSGGKLFKFETLNGNIYIKKQS